MISLFYSSAIRRSSRLVLPFLSSVRHHPESTMSRSNSSIASILDEVKIDLISENYAVENAAKRKEISRTFVCMLNEVLKYISKC